MQALPTYEDEDGPLEELEDWWNGLSEDDQTFYGLLGLLFLFGGLAIILWICL